METNESLRDLNRAAARPFIEYPPTPWWYPVLMGGYFAAITSAMYFGAAGNLAAELGLFIGAILSMFFFFRWYRTRWGTWPRMSEAPPEIRRAYTVCFIASGIALALGVIVALLTSATLTVATVFVLFAGLFWAYERKVYPAACAAVRARLA